MKEGDSLLEGGSLYGFVEMFVDKKSVWMEIISYNGWAKVLHVEQVKDELHVFGITPNDEGSDIFYHKYRVFDRKLELVDSVKLSTGTLRIVEFRFMWINNGAFGFVVSGNYTDAYGKRRNQQCWLDLQVL